MKKFFGILVLRLLFFSSSSYAEWTKVSVNVDGDTYYIDKRSLKIVGDTVYGYVLADYATPNSYGDLSSKSYRQVNCKNMKYKDFVKDYFRMPLGEGDPTSGSGPVKEPKWRSFSPGSSGHVILKHVCKLR